MPCITMQVLLPYPHEGIHFLTPSWHDFLEEGYTLIGGGILGNRSPCTEKLQRQVVGIAHRGL